MAVFVVFKTLNPIYITFLESSGHNELRYNYFDLSPVYYSQINTVKLEKYKNVYIQVNKWYKSVTCFAGFFKLLSWENLRKWIGNLLNEYHCYSRMETRLDNTSFCSFPCHFSASFDTKLLSHYTMQEARLGSSTIIKFTINFISKSITVCLRTS